MELELNTFSINILLYSFLYLSKSSLLSEIIMFFSNSLRFILRLIIVSLEVAPVSNEFNNSEYCKNIASLSLFEATA